jgi:multicomponent K+:H+ antiporter subunit E
MNRIFPAPIMSLTLFAVWLMLNKSISPGNLILAALFAWLVPLFTRGLSGDRPAVKRWPTAIRLGLIVLYDIVLSNIELARRILGPESALTPDFVTIPLDTGDPHAISALAGIITMTPGTLSAEVSDDQRTLLVHAFNVSDKDALVRDIKARYEAPLKEIFKC